MRRRGEDAPIDRIIELDVERRRLIVEGDGLRTRRNQVSREIGRTRERPPELIEEMRGVAARIRALEVEVRDRETEINSLLLLVPNIPRDDVPVAENEAGNVIVRTVGDVPAFEFEPRAHWELGEALGIIEFQRAVKVSGSRFFGFRGKGSKLQRALVSWMLDLHTEEHGYEEMYVPFMVTRESAIGSGHLPKFADTMYHDQEDDMWMVPTAEVPITNLHRREILPAGDRPASTTSLTPHASDARGPRRARTRAASRGSTSSRRSRCTSSSSRDSSDDELERLVADAEDVCMRLGIPHRVVQLCTGDLGDVSAKTYDIEMWAPGSREWLEVSSCSDCTDYQARRASIQYRPEPEARARFVHTLNGSGLGVPRVLIAILESYQQPDGSVVIPEVLRPYTGFDAID